MAWDTSYENIPAGSSNPVNGDDAIRDLKTDIRTRLAKEHSFDLTNTGRQGIHKAGSAMPFVQGSAPTLRVDGTAFVVGVDEGRLWIDTSRGGKMFYLAVASPARWEPVDATPVGTIVASANAFDTDERYIPCDGRQITDSQEAINGEAGAYAELVTRIIAASGGTGPLYVDPNTVKVPDLRGVGLRGIDNFNGIGSALGSASKDQDGTRAPGHYQADGNKAHDHDSPLAAPEHYHTFNWEHAHGIEGANDGSATPTGVDANSGDLNSRIYTSKLAGETDTLTSGVKDAAKAADVLEIPVPSNGNTEATMKNVAVYYYIRY